MTREELKNAREKLGFTQEQLAHRLGVTVSTVQKWEQGVRNIPGIASAFLTDLLGEGEK